MAHAIAPQAPDNARRAFVREVSKLVCEMRILFHDVETDIVLLAQGQCPVNKVATKKCEQCGDTTLADVPFVPSRHSHLSELKTMINAISPALLQLVEKSPVFNTIR